MEEEGGGGGEDKKNSSTDQSLQTNQSINQSVYILGLVYEDVLARASKLLTRGGGRRGGLVKEVVGSPKAVQGAGGLGI